MVAERSPTNNLTTGKVWQTLNIGKPARVTNNLMISGAVHGQTS